MPLAPAERPSRQRLMLCLGGRFACSGECSSPWAGACKRRGSPGRPQPSQAGTARCGRAGITGSCGPEADAQACSGRQPDKRAPVLQSSSKTQVTCVCIVTIGLECAKSFNYLTWTPVPCNVFAPERINWQTHRNGTDLRPTSKLVCAENGPILDVLQRPDPLDTAEHRKTKVTCDPQVQRHFSAGPASCIS